MCRLIFISDAVERSIEIFHFFKNILFNSFSFTVQCQLSFSIFKPKNRLCYTAILAYLKMWFKSELVKLEPDDLTAAMSFAHVRLGQSLESQTQSALHFNGKYPHHLTQWRGEMPALTDSCLKPRTHPYKWRGWLGRRVRMGESQQCLIAM